MLLGANIQAMEGPGILGQDLALGLKTSVGVPKLGLKNETAKSFDTAGIDIRSVLRGTRKQRLPELASVVQLAQPRVQLSTGRAG